MDTTRYSINASIDRSKSPLTTTNYANILLVSFVKCSIGAGSFGLPLAMSNAGWLLGTVAILALGLLSFYTMSIMLHSKELILKELPVNRLNSESDKAHSFDAPLLSDDKPPPLFIFSGLGQHAFGPAGKFVCDLSVFLLLTGVAAGYMIFIHTNFASAVDELSSSIHVPTWVSFLVTPVLPCLLVLLRTYENLAKVASTGVICVMISFLTIFIVGPIYSTPPPVSSLTVFDVSKLPQVLGISAFLLAIHSAVMSFAGELSPFLPAPKMRRTIALGCIIVSISNITIALYGYFLWGNDVNGYVFCNVNKSPAVTTLKFLLCIELLCSLPFAVRPNIEIFEKMAGVEHGGSWGVEMKRNVMRVGLVLLSYGVTIAVPVFQDCLTIVGGVAGSAVAFVIPPAVHLKLLASGTGKGEEGDYMGYGSERGRRWAMAADGAIIVFGVAVQGWTAYSSIESILHPSDDDNNGC